MVVRMSGRVVAGCGIVAMLLAGFAGSVALSGAFDAPRGESRVRMAARPASGGHVAGSAFAVAPGLLVTNAHVTMRCRLLGLPVGVANRDGWGVAAEDPSLELALLSGPTRGAPPALRLSAAPTLPRGTPVLLLGYPLADGSQLGPLRVARGEVERPALTVHRPEAGTSVSFVATGANGRPIDPDWSDGLAYFGAQNADRLRWIVEIGAPTGHGDSGGPVVDGRGGVVGVIFAGSPQARETSAVSLPDLRDFLLRSGVTPLFAPPAGSGVQDWGATGDLVAASVVRVGC